MDSPKIVLEANYNVWIENYIGIIEYSDKEVKVNTADFIVKNHGREPAYGFCHKRGFEYFGKKITSVVYE
ncbi:MAG: YabP/YqfC family sporulation protein [Clostridiales bacterium]|nr:MAG: YabP/YqfC family sporulation protein [Clostridiales bacterium]